MLHGYEPSRITNLAQQARQALAALDEIRTTDPAAADALAALAGLRSVIADVVIPATIAVTTIDPLGTNGSPAAPPAADWYSQWLAGLVVTDHGAWSDDELFTELERLEDGLPFDDDFRPDMTDPSWTGFEQLSIELAVRAECDPRFAERLAERAVDTFLIPLALRFARFDPELVADMLLTVTEWPSWSIDLVSNYRAYGAGLLIDFLTDFPVIAMAVLVDPRADRDDGVTLLEDLLRWPALDESIVAEFVDAAMSAPFEHPELLAQAGTALGQLVDVANRRGLFPNGFPSELGPVLAKIVVQYLPFFVTSLDERGDVHLKDFDMADIGIELGSYGDVLDLLGLLLRDPTASKILLGAIPALAVLGRGDGDGNALDLGLDDVANYLRALRKAARNEQLEELREARRVEVGADLAVEMISVAIGLVTSVTGPLAASGMAVSIGVIEVGAKLIAQWAITATDLDLDAVATIAYLLMTYGIGVTVVRTRDDAVGGDDAETAVNVIVAEEILERIDAALAAGRPVDEVEGLLGDLRRVTATIDGDTASILDDPRVAPPEYDVEAKVDDEE